MGMKPWLPAALLILLPTIAWGGHALAQQAGSAPSRNHTGLADATVAIQQQLSAVPAEGGTVTLAPGRYLVTRSLLMKSGTKLVCQPGATLVANPDWPDFHSKQIVKNANFNATAITDHDLEVQGCGFDYTDFTAVRNNGDAHALSFRMARHIRISNINCTAGGDCTAMRGTEDSVVENSRSLGTTNACWDHWESPVRVVVRNNSCIVVPQGYGTRYGVLVTGSPGGTGLGKGSGAVIANNSFKGPFGAAIWINGLGQAGSGVSHVGVTSNTIDMAGQAGHAIKVSGAGTDIVVEQNRISGSGQAVVVTSGGDVGGMPGNVRVTGNTIDGVTVSPGNVAVIANDAQGTVVSGNRITGGNYPFGISLGGASDSANDNAVDAGRGGRYTVSRGNPHMIDGKVATQPQR
jgi:hypothetical protein